MKSKLAIAVVLFGWFITISYIIYDYNLHGVNRLRHPFIPQTSTERFFHVVIVFTFFGTHITGYLINNRKKLLQKTQLSEKQIKRVASEWRATFDSMPYGVMLADNEFNIIRANKYIADLSGILLKEMVFNKKCYKIIHKVDKPIDDCPLEKSIKTQKTETLEYYDSNHSKYFMASVTPVFDDEGSAVVYVQVLIDTTDIKQKEKKLVQSKEAFFNMLKDVTSAYKELEGLQHDLIIAFANALDAKSHWTKGHSERVTHYALSIAKEIGIEEEDLKVLQTAALLHDVGKIGTYDVLLDKPGKLTAEEFKLVMKHPAKGVEILAPIKGLENMLPLIRSHHEKINGKGYPDGLKGDEIPLLSKILCVADSYDSMTADRPYRLSPGKDYAISEFKRCSGTQFEPQVVEAFIRVLEREG